MVYSILLQCCLSGVGTAAAPCELAGVHESTTAERSSSLGSVDLRVTPLSANAIDIRWTYPGEALEFEIERSKTSAEGPFHTIATVRGVTRGFTDVGLLSEHEYWYRVRALADGGSTSRSKVSGAGTAPLFAVRDFTIVALPDTQYYAEDNSPIFARQTEWIVDKKDELGIVYVAHLGDCVQTAGDVAQWDLASAAFALLENPATTNLTDGIPYGIAVGNKDQSPVGAASPQTTTANYNAYFGASRFNGRAYFGGNDGLNDNDNHYELFDAGPLRFIVIHLEFQVPSPLPSVLAWANDLLANQYPDRRAIVVSHQLLVLGSPAPFSSQGQAIYDALKGNPNLFLMLAGHVPGEGVRTDEFAGNVVTTVFADYQNLLNGGDGWLRLLRFRPSLNEIEISTYSPTLDEYGDDGTMGVNTTSVPFTLVYEMGGTTPEHASFGGRVSLTSDTTLEEDLPGTPLGSAEAVTWDSVPPEFGLLRFREIFGDRPGQIPPGSGILSATLQVNIHNLSTSLPASVHEVLVDWSEESATFGNFGGEPGVQVDEFGELIGSLAGDTGYQLLDVTRSLAKWSLAPVPEEANKGWILRPNGPSSGGFRSSEFVTVEQRPGLEVRFFPPAQ